MKGKKNGCGNHKMKCSDYINCADHTCHLSLSNIEAEKLRCAKTNNRSTKLLNEIEGMVRHVVGLDMIPPELTKWRQGVLEKIAQLRTVR